MYRVHDGLFKQKNTNRSYRAKRLELAVFDNKLCSMDISMMVEYTVEVGTLRFYPARQDKDPDFDFFFHVFFHLFLLAYVFIWILLEVESNSPL